MFALNIVAAYSMNLYMSTMWLQRAAQNDVTGHLHLLKSISLFTRILFNNILYQIIWSAMYNPEKSHMNPRNQHVFIQNQSRWKFYFYVHNMPPNGSQPYLYVLFKIL